MTDATIVKSPGGPARTPPSLGLRFMHRVANPVVSAVLRSSLHRLLSGSLLLLTYTRRRDGTERTIPVQYVERDETLVAFAGRAAEKVWWRNLRSGAPVRLRLHGSVRTGLAAAVTGDHEAIAAARGAYLERFPRARTTDAVLVRITLDRPG